MMQPCPSQSKCFCQFSISEDCKSTLRTHFQLIKDSKTQKKFIEDMLVPTECDDNNYERCFKVSDGRFLCREGLSSVLKLSTRKQQQIIPSARFLRQRYCIICIGEIFRALIVYRHVILNRTPTTFSATKHTYIKRIDWSLPCFTEAVKLVN
jgi:hypothetical protein